jgi:hypothetical protein
MLGIEANGVRFDAASLTVARAIWPLPVFAILAYATRPRDAGTARFPWVEFAIAAVLVGFGFNYLYQLAVANTSAAHVVLLQGVAPLCLAAFASRSTFRAASRSGSEWPASRASRRREPAAAPRSPATRSWVCGSSCLRRTRSSRGA